MKEVAVNGGAVNEGAVSEGAVNEVAMNAPELSVLLTSWNTREETRRCLESLEQATAGGLTYEVVAVDNASKDGSAELLAAHPRVRLIRNPRNVGFAPAVNQAFRASRGTLILLLNSDVRFHPGALDTLVQFLRDRPDAAGVSPLYLNPDGTFQQHYVREPSFLGALALFTSLRKLPGFRGALHRFEMRGEDFSKPRQLASGSCQLLRRGVISDRVFDERFPIYWNDAVLARQLRDAGHELWLLPDAVVTHTRGASCRLLGPAMRFRHLVGGLVCFLKLTQPAYKLAIFRLALLANYVVRTLAGRSTILGLADLLAALRGDVGPVPDGDARDWAILVGACGGEPDLGSRVLLVDPPARRVSWRFTVVQLGPTVWRATLPTTLPGGLAPMRWLNARMGAARLRRWLDRHAGARTLHVADRHRHFVGWLGEDVVSTVGAPDRSLELAHG